MGKDKLLIIEDDVIALHELAEIAERESFDVVQSQDGNSGYEIFLKEKPDAVLTDLKIPGLNGFELMEKIKKIQPGIPIILITGYGETEIAIDAIKLGALDYLKKPLDIDTLLIALGRTKEKIRINKNIETFPTVLVADDDGIAREALVDVLRKENWTILTAQDGEEALNLFEKNKIDVVLLDIKMPKLNGIASLHKMRSIREDFEAIILTGYGDEESAIQALRNGAMNFIKKPIDLEQLIILINNAINKITLERAFKFRTRELELANQIIAHITQEDEIKICISDETLLSLKKQGLKIIDSFSTGIIVLDNKMNIIIHNEYANKILQGIPEIINDNFLNKVKKIGIIINYDEFKMNIDTLCNMPVGSFKRIEGTNNMNIIFTSIYLIMRDKKNIYILTIIQDTCVDKRFKHE